MFLQILPNSKKNTGAGVFLNTAALCALATLFKKIPGQVLWILINF